MKGVINGTLVDRKINLFSAHDVNVVAVLNALGVYDNSFPPFSSAVIVELLEKNDNYYVRVSNIVLTRHVILKIPATANVTHNISFNPSTYCETFSSS